MLGILSIYFQDLMCSQKWTKKYILKKWKLSYYMSQQNESAQNANLASQTYSYLGTANCHLAKK